MMLESTKSLAWFPTINIKLPGRTQRSKKLVFFFKKTKIFANYNERKLMKLMYYYRNVCIYIYIYIHIYKCLFLRLLLFLSFFSSKTLLMRRCSQTRAVASWRASPRCNEGRCPRRRWWRLVFLFLFRAVSRLFAGWCEAIELVCLGWSFITIQLLFSFGSLGEESGEPTFFLRFGEIIIL